MRWALVDFRHPFFRPMIRRIIVFALVAAWTVVEFTGGSFVWTVFFLALTVYLGWGFFLSGDAGPAEPDDRGDGPPAPPGGTL